MSNTEYRVALYQAISKAMMENKKYVGAIEKKENGEYYVLEDSAQELAVYKYEKIQENLKTKRKEKGEER